MYQLKLVSNKIDEINKDDSFLQFTDEIKKLVPSQIDKMPESLPAYQVTITK